MIPVNELFAKIADRQFQAADARKLIKTSYYFAGAHPDVHIVLSSQRPADFHFQHVPEYEERGRPHSMFTSMDDAAEAVAAALNCAAGEAALRFLSVSGVKKIAIYSRSGARKAGTMKVRTAVASMGTRTGTMYGEEKVEVVVIVLSFHSGGVVLTTAYPAQMLRPNRPMPPEGSDMVEYGAQTFIYAA